MKHKTRTKALSWLLSLALALSLVPGMSLTAQADNPYSSLKNTTTAVHFDNKDWYLIDYDDSTVTLLSKECVGASKFNSDGSSIYSGSTVETFVNNWYTNNISAAAQEAVNGSGMFLLTTAQANALSVDVRKCPMASEAIDIIWWLCSPGLKTGAACVYGDNGDVVSDGGAAWDTLGVRPALKLDLSKVTFDSVTEIFSLKPTHTHNFTYSADGATITATCANTDQKCTLDDGTEQHNHTATLTIKPPANLVYDNKAKAATVENNINNDELTITYTKINAEVAAENVKETGFYTASVTLGEQTASVTFEIKDPTYTIYIPATLDVENAGWNATAGITAYGEIAEDKKLTVTATSANNWKLTKTGQQETIAYKLAESGDSTTTYAGATEKTVWDFSVDELAAENGTTKTMGAVVEEYINKPAGDYADTVTFTAKVAYTPRTYHELKSGDVLRVGDIVDDPNTVYWFSNKSDSLKPSFTYTLLRADITLQGHSPAVTEKDDGAYYVFKAVNRQYGYEEYTVEVDPYDHFIKLVFNATSTSDGLEITQPGGNWNIAVHDTAN